LNENGNDYAIIMVEGCDLTYLLGIKKYIPPVNGQGSNFGNMTSKGDFPTHIVSKTDETNLASKTYELQFIQGKRVYITLKIEGSSLTTLWDKENNELMVCSRNNQIGEHETNKFWQVVNKYNLKEKVMEFPWLVVQGELAGSGVQKNKLGIEGNDLFVFNMIDTRSSTKLNYDELVDMSSTLSVQLVPVIMVIDNFNMTFDELQELADKQVYSNGELAEGIVVRSCEPVDRKGVIVDWSYKVLNREYKL
jgi:RNA ligase (TIGR02306 family)